MSAREGAERPKSVPRRAEKVERCDTHLLRWSSVHRGPGVRIACFGGPVHLRALKTHYITPEKVHLKSLGGRWCLGALKDKTAFPLARWFFKFLMDILAVQDHVHVRDCLTVTTRSALDPNSKYHSDKKTRHGSTRSTRRIPCSGLSPYIHGVPIRGSVTLCDHHDRNRSSSAVSSHSVLKESVAEQKKGRSSFPDRSIPSSYLDGRRPRRYAPLASRGHSHSDYLIMHERRVFFTQAGACCPRRYNSQKSTNYYPCWVNICFYTIVADFR